ncbi:MAG TPA: diguanylate cyclase [Candidatus Dormibacteraeota bacterium]|nr:diguanylate cyclase [Candidatus Dormibacteraeota bacterium]
MTGGRPGRQRLSLSTRVGIVVVVLGASLSAAVLYIPLSQRSVSDRQAALDGVGEEITVATGLLQAEQRSLAMFATEAARAAATTRDLVDLADRLSAVTSPEDVVAIVGPSGSEVGAAGATLGAAGWPWLSAAATTSQTLVADPSGRGWLLGSAAVPGSPSTHAAVARELSRTQLAALSATSASGAAGGFAVVRDGRYVLSGAVAGRLVGTGGTVDGALAGAASSDAPSAVVSVAGADVAAASRSLGSGFRLLVTIPVSGSRSIGDDVPVVAVTIVLVLTALAGVYALVRRDLQRPLMRLEAALAALGREDFDAPVPQTGDETVDRVTSSFLAMRTELRTLLRTSAARADIARDLASASSLDGALRAVCCRLRDVTGARLAIAVIAAHNGRPAVLHADGTPQPGDPAALLGDGGVVASAFASPRHGAVLACAIRTSDAGMRYEDVCAASLHAGGASLGTLAISGAEPGRPFEAHTIALVEAAAEQVALSVERERVLHTARLQASTDDLTGLHNRRFLTDFLEQQVAMADRAATVLSVLMLDVDDFKVINDEHGHEVGNEALRALARTLSGTLRRSDLAARVGGDEFLVVMTDTSTVAAAGVAEKLRRTVAALTVEAPGARAPVRMTVSVGVASREPSGPGVDGILTMVDDAMYDAKRQGRDRVAIARRPASMRLDPGADRRREPPDAGRSPEPDGRGESAHSDP